MIDDLHGLYLGITLTLLKLWFNRVHKGKAFYIGDKVRKD